MFLEDATFRTTYKNQSTKSNPELTQYKNNPSSFIQKEGDKEK